MATTDTKKQLAMQYIKAAIALDVATTLLYKAAMGEGGIINYNKAIDAIKKSLDILEQAKELQE